MLNINNVFFLLGDLNTITTNYSVQTQRKLIIPGIIFSLGAIMLIVCVLVQNIQRKRKLAEAERLKRERIKKFADESTMRYQPQAPTQEEIDRQNRFMRQNAMIEQQKREEQEKKIQNASNTLMQNRQQPVQSAPQVMPQQPAGMQAPQAPMPPVNNRQMPNTINPAVPNPYQAPQPQQVPTMVTPQVQPSMGGQVLPGMAASGMAIQASHENTNTTNIKELVKANVEQVNNQKRQELSGQVPNESENKAEAVTPQAAEKQITPSVQPQTIQGVVKPNEEIKEEQPKEKKPFKFEYKPDYKPGQEPKDSVKIEIPLNKDAENKNENENENKEEVKPEVKEQPSSEVQKISFDAPVEDGNREEVKLEEKTEEKKQEEKQEQKINPNDMSLLSIQQQVRAKLEEEKEKKQEEEKQEPSKAPKVVVERNETFVSADEEERDIIAKEEAKPIVIERAPVIPKIVTKKVDYNPGFLREVQNKINASRDYQEQFEIKEEEKLKLTNELLEKRMNLEKMKAKLKDELKEKEDTEKLSKEQISKSLLDTTDKGIVYEEGKKVSLFDTELIKKVESLDRLETVNEEKEEPKQEVKEEIKLEEKAQEVKPEIKVQEQKQELKEEHVEVKKEVQEQKVQEEIKPEVKVQEEQHVEVKNEKTEEEKIAELKEQLRREIKEELKQEQQEKTLKEQITETNSEVKTSSPVLNQIDYLFSSIDEENNKNKNSRKDNIQDKLNQKIQNAINKKQEEPKQEAIKQEVEVQKEVEEVKEEITKDPRELVKEKIKNMVKETKSEEPQKNNSSLVNSDFLKKIDENLENTMIANTEDDPIKRRVKEKLEQERLRKVEELNMIKELRAQRNQPERTKSILGGVDIDKEILENKTKQISTLNDTPSYKKIIVVVSPDSCGKTTVAVNLAYELANRGLKTCIIDTDNIKKDVYYYINQDRVGCLSRLNEFDEAEDMYNLGYKVNDRLTAFTENKGIEFEINYSKLFKLINFAHEVNDAVIIDVKSTLGNEKTKDLLKLSTNILFVIDKKITTLNRIADKFAKTKGGFVNKDVTLVVNMDEGRGVNKAAVKSIFKHLEYIENGEKKSYQIRIGEMFTVLYDTKSIITGLISQEPAVTVKENSMLQDIRKIASHFYEAN